MGEPEIKCRVNPLFILVVTGFVLAGMLKEILLAFLLVFLHEIAHTIVAYFLGYKLHRLELFPFGGMVEYRGLLEMEPVNEAVIAGSGPLFNFILALILSIFKQYSPIIGMACKFNIILGLFNLLPALPLDGGRILRSYLVNKMGFKRGTLLAVKLAKITAVAGIITGVIALALHRSNLWILLISFFVYGAVLREDQGVIYYLTYYLTARADYLQQKDYNPVLWRMVKGELKVRETVHFLSPAGFNIFIILGRKLDVRAKLTEAELLDVFFNLRDKNMTLNDIINSRDT